jgi:hypothetical protein
VVLANGIAVNAMLAYARQKLLRYREDKRKFVGNSSLQDKILWEVLSQARLLELEELVESF